jgi:hypothetical protein
MDRTWPPVGGTSSVHQRAGQVSLVANKVEQIIKEGRQENAPPATLTGRVLDGRVP